MFYIRPPKGLMTFHVLEDIILSRLEYLNLLHCNKTKEFMGNFGHLLEESANDCVGHFALRLLSSVSNGFFTHWLETEALFFNQRLLYSYPRQLKRLFSTIVKHLKKKNEFFNSIDITIYDVCQFLLQIEIFKHIFLDNHSDECNEYHVKVPFEMVTDLIETRSVDLSQGFAIIYCSQWKELLQSLLKTFITLEMDLQQDFYRNTVLSDSRLYNLVKRIHSSTFDKHTKLGIITASNIDREVEKFPPCMQHLHKELRKKHRLSHYARFYYTLFLKDCGMSLEQSFLYWKNEYSKPHDCTSVCTHDWKNDEKKFTYSIRHMYGLEGGLKNYKCPNCNSISKEIPGPQYEGGCPFKNFDKDSLKILLGSSIDERNLDSLLMKYPNHPQQVCTSFLSIKNGKSYREPLNSPVKFYQNVFEPH